MDGVLKWVVLLTVVTACRIGFDTGSLAADQATLDFSMLPCGGTSTSNVTVNNTGHVAFSFTVVSDIPGVTVTPAEGMLAPGASTQLSVAATASAAATPGEAMSGELVIAADEKTIPALTIPVTITTSGAVLVTDMTTLDFGQVTTSTSHSGSVMVENTGNAAVSVMAGPFGNGPFTITSSPSFQLAPGATQAVGVQFDPPAVQGYSFQLPLIVNGAMCAAVPDVAVRGTGTNATVLLDHTTIDFGNVACGSSGSSAPLKLTNANASAFPYTATVTSGGSSFTASPTSGSVPAMNSTTVDVTSASVPVPSTPGMVTGNLHVVVTGSGTTDVALQYNVFGSYLTPATTMLDFGQVDYPKTLTVMVTNSGNDVADVTMTRSGSSYYSGPTSFQIAPNTSAMVSITFSPPGINNTYTASFTLDATGACSSSFTIQTTGRGDN